MLQALSCCLETKLMHWNHYLPFISTLIRTICVTSLLIGRCSHLKDLQPIKTVLSYRSNYHNNTIQSPLQTSHNVVFCCLITSTNIYDTQWTRMMWCAFVLSVWVVKLKIKKQFSNAFVNMSVSNVEIRLFLYKVVHEVIAFKLTIITRCGSETNI